MDTLPSPESLVLEYQGLARSIVKGYRNMGIDEEDLMQEAMIGILEAAKRFDPSHQTKFSTYAVYWIKKQILASLGKQGFHAQTEEIKDSEQIAATKQVFPQIQRLELPNGFPPDEARILRLSMEQGLSLKEISSLLGRSTESCKQLRQKALRRLRNMAVK